MVTAICIAPVSLHDVYRSAIEQYKRCLGISPQNLRAQNYLFLTTSFFRIDSVDSSEWIFTKL